MLTRSVRGLRESLLLSLWPEGSVTGQAEPRPQGAALPFGAVVRPPATLTIDS